MNYEYHLINKSGESINKIKTETLEDAIKIFAKIKKLKPSQLLEIYKVEKK